MNRYILLLAGPVCSGKTTLVTHFLEKEKRVYSISLDAIKNRLSDFRDENDQILLNDLAIAVSNRLAKDNLSLIVDGRVQNLEEMRQFYSKLAADTSRKFLEVNIEAPMEVLLERLRNRVEAGRAKTVKDPEQLIERHKIYESKKHKLAPTFDSSILSTEEIYFDIQKLLQQEH
jgi:predicted kinase